MSALVLTVLICLVWVGITAFGYIRGGWREVVTLAAILLAYAVASEWAASNGRDLAGLFGGNTYRSTTTIALAYLFGGTLLFGYFGGSRLPRPIPLSATERFVGGGVGLLNGSLLAALTLRILRAYTFGPGDGQVLQDTALARLLIGDIGYVLLVGLIAAMIAPFLSSLLVRPPQYAAQYDEDPALQAVPPLGYAPAPDAPQPQPAYAPPASIAANARATLPVYPVPVPVVARAEPVPLSPSAPSAPAPLAAVALVPTAPSLPRAVPVPLWPTPGLPALAAAATNGTSDADAVAPAIPANATTETAPPVNTPPEPARPGPPGSEAASPPPTAGDATRAAVPAPSLPAFTTGPAPFTARPAPTDAPSTMTNAGATPFILAPTPSPAAAPPVTEQAEKPPMLPTAANAPRVAADTVISPSVPPTARELVPTAPVLPRAPEMPLPAIAPATPADAPTDNEETSVPGHAGVSRARVATARVPESPAESAPDTLSVTHPCPVCAYPVRNGARFCPNCGSAQPRA